MILARVLLIVLMLASFGSAQSNELRDSAWRELKSLVGTWQIAAPKTPGQKAFRISYRLISRDSALVETFGDPSKQVTETLYHLDGENLLATHYCAQGNQPRLRLRASADKQELSFEFLDATNLKDVNDSHLIRLKLKRDDQQRLVRQEVYSERGVESPSSLVLERSR